jgi:hypothetical protein
LIYWAEGRFSARLARIYICPQFHLLAGGVEAFPFHKAFKCLTEADGESMAYFVRGVAHELKAKGLLMPGMMERLPRAD